MAVLNIVAGNFTFILFHDLSQEIDCEPLLRNNYGVDTI